MASGDGIAVSLKVSDDGGCYLPYRSEKMHSLYILRAKHSRHALAHILIFVIR